MPGALAREDRQVNAVLVEFLVDGTRVGGERVLLADEGQTGRAIELYALASRHAFVANSRWFEDVAGKQIAAMAATLSKAVVTAARKRGRARGLDATVAGLLTERRT